MKLSKVPAVPSLNLTASFPAEIPLPVMVILEIEGIEEVAVVGVPDNVLGQLIKAVIVLSPGAKVDKRDIMRYCKENLAPYKMPKKIEIAEQLPRTASGKLRRFMLLEKG